MDLKLATTPLARTFHDQREFDRMHGTLAGTLFAGDVFHPCIVLDVSQAGARITCDHSLPLNSHARLYIDGFGNFESRVIRCENEEPGLLFVFKDAKRFQVIDKLAQFVESGANSPSQANRRVPTTTNAFGCFTCADGYLISFYILDISLNGMSVKTLVRPPVGEIVSFGGTYGRVTRHHDQGVTIQFVNDKAERSSATPPAGPYSEGLYLSPVL